MKQTIVIFMGGFSSERSISIKSGNVVFDALDSNKYDKYRIVVSDNHWQCFDASDEECQLDKGSLSIRSKSNWVKADCAIIAIHGSPGENGQLQSYLDMIGIPYTGSGAYPSALTFNKRNCLSVLKEIGVPCATSYLLNLGDPIDAEAIIAKVGLPCFVKANCAGSSYGITKVNIASELMGAIDVAFREGNDLLIESCLEGVEVSVGVITYRGETVALPVTEIVTSNAFFDYEAKYLGKSQEITPARISIEMTNEVQALALKIFKHLNLSGYSRSEFIFVDQLPHLLEVNTIPGLTKESILPKQAESAGISLNQLFDNAIQEALKNSKL
jgi:D-alanine-D-alanine ligase